MCDMYTCHKPRTRSRDTRFVLLSSTCNATLVHGMAWEGVQVVATVRRLLLQGPWEGGQPYAMLALLLPYAMLDRFYIAIHV